MVSLFGLDPATYRSHPLHAAERTYQETNCYTDLLIELLHARGDEPLACLGSIVRMDFEGDQWTFFKPPPEDLERLFGVDIHEMQPYRSMPDQIAELLADGRSLTVELDAWHLPDTASSSYRTEHVKTGVAAEAIDLLGQRLRYFHNTSLHELSGEDYRGVFRVDHADDEILPPYTELIRFDAGPRLEGAALRAASREILRHHLDRVHAGNPFDRFGVRLSRDLPDLLAGDVARFHAYAFATVRMAGAGFELCASHVGWLLGDEGGRAVTAMSEIVEGSKLLGFKLARRRPFDAEAAIDALSEAWDVALGALDDAVR
ncbi:MAG: DUF1839 family protein [Chloroflexi bacterium]|nr:DUF1839 family protein [Chloroflexota bacterium]